MSPLNGLEIVLVGGGGGLGSASAELLMTEGATVIISSRSQGIRADITCAGDRERLLHAELVRAGGVGGKSSARRRRRGIPGVASGEL